MLIPNFDLTLWTNDPQLASRAEKGGVSRIGLDLETLGKEKRQAGMNTWISCHHLSQLPVIKKKLSRAKLFARCNPLGNHSHKEVETLLAAGTEIIMLPNFKTAKEVSSMLDLINGRAQLIPLVERSEAVYNLEDIVKLNIEEIHIGLNDLSIDLQEKNRLALLSKPIMDQISNIVITAKLKLGIGGVARANDESLPVPSNLIYARLAQLKATGALISRSFNIDKLSTKEIAEEIKKTREHIHYWRQSSVIELNEALNMLKKSTGYT
ncbi:HpcH/HpaI aldolase/citrate lyase family protein [Xenococcus sp. PCC 7305]|uniref:aldolase/citrate lyase family protein n=1 Tax=Xenococcus sp. PCC 7305 TaxID=102125 RepID=UPI0002AC318C|nr:aldolase/citrate lyase family protein [Xenococcus sp. PCC 7305]ELS00690.1 HpcH/HpaI aldolase/citrate lyase family protein [Xenococcus sp. PCC 7305]